MHGHLGEQSGVGRVPGRGRTGPGSRRILGGLAGIVLVVGLLTACDTSPVVAQGSVTNPAGASVADVDVVVYANDTETVVATTTTSPVGTWAVRSSTLDEGTYRVKIGDVFWPDAASWAAATPVVFDTTAPANLTSMVDPATRLTGSVVDATLAPVAGVAVTAVDGDGRPVGLARTDASGAFRLSAAAGAGTYRVTLGDEDEGSAVDVGAPAPILFEVTGGQDLRIGAIDGTTGARVDLDALATTAQGPYGFSTTTVARGNGFGGGTIYAPDSDAHAPYGAVVVTPGWLMNQSKMSWYGPRLASQGFVVLTIDTLGISDQPPARATQMLAALDWLTSSSPFADRVDPDRTALMGWSMGGGGTLDAALQRPSLSTVIALAPWESRKDYSAIRSPTLIVACDNDILASAGSHAIPMYQSLTVDREYIQIPDSDHFCVTSDNTDETHRKAIARQTLGFLQRYVNGDERYADVICPAPPVGPAISDSRSSCPF